MKKEGISLKCDTCRGLFGRVRCDQPKAGLWLPFVRGCKISPINS